MKNNYQQLLTQIENKEKITFGLLLDKKGSAPQVPGASALFNQQGLLHGTLGGGILEMKAEELAVSHWPAKDNQLCEVDYTSDIGEDTGAICGGIATFLLDFNPEASLSTFKAMHSDLKLNKSGYLLSRINKNNPNKINRSWVTNPILEDEVNEAIATLKDNETSALINKNDDLIFIEYLSPAPQLLIVGAGHIGQALCHQGALLNFNVSVVDNRPKYAKQSLVPDADLLIIEPNLKDGIQQLNIDTNTYVVIVTQGHKSDCEALQCVIKSKATYIGMIGSKRKIQQVKGDFIKRSICSEEEFNQIYAPIGLNIGSKTVQEIAISIAAELIAERNRKKNVRFIDIRN
ncbi:XdhC family protein [Carboxylicivirga sp. N1Y90]|uniref:XdhC family protein n=1 Tax=Carboxylicivirga fragile TaxID=3417571 RepID=UPI003D3350F1|nr:XdhC family protein [Marinilabiliaceae bacterium N1Y90]